jgi:glycosyltransferase involved in cell wall biosynthesis
LGKLGLGHLVKLHGYTRKTELNEALQASHLANQPALSNHGRSVPVVNYASGTTLLPSLVTDVGWYSSLSRDTVAHVRPEHEIADIQSQLGTFLKDPELFVKMGHRGFRTLCEEHDPEKYVSAILDVAAIAGSSE